MQVECLDYRELPGQNPLFLKYLYHFDEVSGLYAPGAPAPLDIEALERRVEAVAKRPVRFSRERLVSLLDPFNRMLGAGEVTQQNIQKLKRRDTVAVVTGQQLGLFGGPALAVYKAATAIRLSQILEDRGYSAVPVFWLPSDDSDFMEVRSTSFYDRADELLDVRYPGAQSDSQMVGTIRLKRISEILEQLKHEAQRAEFLDSTLQTLGASYRPDQDFRQAHGQWLAGLFEEHGLVLFDSLIPGYKPELTGVFTRLVEKRSEALQALRQRSQELIAAGFTPQVSFEDSETLLFSYEGKTRHKLVYQDGEYQSKKRKLGSYSPDELLYRIESDPESFGPNVLLRPIVQDHLFPTAVYVGGPSEVAYFAQVSAIASRWGVEPSIFPRMGVTVVDRKAQRLLKKYSLEAGGLMSGDPMQAVQGLLNQGGAGEVLRTFDSVQQELRSQLSSLKAHINRSDPGMVEMMLRAENRIIYHIEKLQRRFVANYRQRDEAVGRHLDYLQYRLCPEGKLQERAVNFNQFLIQEGPTFINSVMEEVQPFCLSHQVLYV